MQPSAFAGPFTWSSGAYGPGNMQALEAMLRMWGVNPESQRWQDMMRDFKRGETVFNQVSCLRLWTSNSVMVCDHLRRRSAAPVMLYSRLVWAAAGAVPSEVLSPGILVTW